MLKASCHQPYWDCSPLGSGNGTSQITSKGHKAVVSEITLLELLGDICWGHWENNCLILAWYCFCKCKMHYGPVSGAFRERLGALFFLVSVALRAWYPQTTCHQSTDWRLWIWGKRKWESSTSSLCLEPCPTFRVTWEGKNKIFSCSD